MGEQTADARLSARIHALMHEVRLLRLALQLADKEFALRTKTYPAGRYRTHAERWIGEARQIQEESVEPNPST